jgi:hypothetical protein
VYIVRFRHPHLFSSMCLIPWAALCAEQLLRERRLLFALLLGLVVAVGALGGGPQAPYMMWLFAAAYLGAGVWGTCSAGERLRALWALSWRSAVGALAFVGLTAVQFLPAAELVRQSARGDRSLAFVGSYSLAPASWLRLLAPDVFGNDMAHSYFGPANYHEQTLYLGVAPLLLLVLACVWRRRAEPERSLLSLGAGFLVLAAGRHMPLFYAAYFLIPGWRLFRSPARYGWFVALLAATVVGLIVTRIAAGERPPDPERVRRVLRRVWVALAALCILTAIAAGPLGDRFTTLHPETMRWALAKAASLLVLAGLLLDAWLSGTSSPQRTTLALIALTATDLGLQWLPYRQTVSLAEAFPPVEITRALAAAAPGRVLVHVYRGDGLPEIVPLLNWGEAAGYDDLRGYNQLVPSEVLQLFARADIGGLAQAKHYALAPVDPPDWLLDLAAVRRIVARPSDWPTRWRSLPLVASAGDYEVRERPGELPRAWLVGAVEQRDRATALQRLPSLDLRRVAVVETDLALPRTTSTPPGEVRRLARSADALTLQVNARSDALLVLAERFDPGWSANVDGRPAIIHRTDFLLRGVRVARGRHTVQMQFHVAGKTAAQCITLVSAAVVGILLIALLRKGLP